MVPSAPRRVQRRARMSWLGIELWLVLLVMGIAAVVAVLVLRRKP